MDGNGRWAKRRGLPRIFGHRAGMKAVRKAVEFAYEKKIPYLTLFAFSTENWGRPRDEVEGLMNLLKEYVDRELPEMKKKGIRLNVIGDLDRLPEDVREKVDRALRETEDNEEMVLTLALSYSGRDEIVRAVRRMLRKRSLRARDVTEETLREHLDSPWIPEPDLLIRTSGEMRVSNFMLWQLAYTEIYVSEKLWPQFTKAEFKKALDDYARRKRRFGLTDEQIEEEPRGENAP
ncbi:MAG: di-trans,poly-cis-decaprenylcistransferase [Deltaproteobacteria bacterium]|nr:MAG: di-trans,poly-cis-decaprenylcistransferase [Deltaproteobacteria bacterium]